MSFASFFLLRKLKPIFVFFSSPLDGKQKKKGMALLIPFTEDSGSDLLWHLKAEAQPLCTEPNIIILSSDFLCSIRDSQTHWANQQNNPTTGDTLYNINMHWARMGIDSLGMDWTKIEWTPYDKYRQLILGGAAVSALFLYKVMKPGRDSNLPAGPRSWPIVGSLGPRGWPILASVLGKYKLFPTLEKYFLRIEIFFRTVLGL